MYPSEKSEKGQIINLILKNKAVHLINSNRLLIHYKPNTDHYYDYGYHLEQYFHDS